MSKTYKSILSYFGVDSQEELLEFMAKNPNDPKAIELKELIEAMEDGLNE